jgi:acyl-CoA synthetase (AMP-forming)/AMP-acid ligase II
MALENFTKNSVKEEDTYLHTLPEVLRARADESPGKTAYIFLRDGESDEEKITYGELCQESNEIANILTNLNLKGDRALMLYPPGLSFIKALFGCFYAGVIAVPAYPPRKNRSLDRIKTLVADSGPKIVLTTHDIYRTFERSFSDVEELKGLTWIPTDAPNLPSSPPPRFPASMPPCPYAPLPSDTALLQYTSGSTGQPKGVMVTHQNLMRNLEFLRQAFELGPETIAVHWLPVFHDMGLVFGVMEPIYCGYLGILMPPVSFIQKPIRWLKAISTYHATLGGAPNFAYDLCVSGIPENDCRDLDLSKLKTLYNGAEPVRKKTLDTFTEKFRRYGFKPEKFYPTYGMAEATLILSGGMVSEKPVILYVDKAEIEKNSIKITDENDPNAYSLVSVGQPRIDTKIITVDPVTFEPCYEDKIGEIWVSGSIVTKGYWNNIKATSLIFGAFTRGNQEGPYLRTGDLGFFHKGELYISGRLKDLIIIHGRNYYPQDIEFIAEKCHPALRPNASAAFSINVDDKEKLVIVSEVERTALRDINVEEICNAVRQKINEEMELVVYAVRLIRTASIPITSSGKIRRRACRDGFLENTLETVGDSILNEMTLQEKKQGYTVDLASIQVWLMAWIHTKLKVAIERIDPGKPITSYGLTSIKAVQLQQEFLTKYGVNFPPYMFFERISLKELSERALKLIKEEG